MWCFKGIELKSDLRDEELDVLAIVPDYYLDAVIRSGSDRAPVGLSTDDADILAFVLGDVGFVSIGRYRVDQEQSKRLLGRLEPLVDPHPIFDRRLWQARAPLAVTN